MDPQIANFFTHWTAEIEALTDAIVAIKNRNQEAIDRGIPAQLGAIQFSEYGDLDHLSAAEISAAFDAFTAVDNVLSANGRAGWEALYMVVR